MEKLTKEISKEEARNIMGGTFIREYTNDGKPVLVAESPTEPSC